MQEITNVLIKHEGGDLWTIRTLGVDKKIIAFERIQDVALERLGKFLTKKLEI